MAMRGRAQRVRADVRRGGEGDARDAELAQRAGELCGRDAAHEKGSDGELPAARLEGLLGGQEIRSGNRKRSVARPESPLWAIATTLPLPASAPPAATGADTGDIFAFRTEGSATRRT